MNRTLLASVVCLIWLGLTCPVPGQPVLERLEQRIRGRLDGPADVAQPAEPADDRPQGYLGAVADDTADRGRGVRILEIHAGSPAEKAGLRPKDLVTGLAGIRIRQMADMADVLEAHAPGDSVEFEVLRNGQTSKIKVTMGDRRAERPAAAAVQPPDPVEPPVAVSPPDDVTPVEKLQRRIEQLERRVAELERLVGELSKKKP
ncbi:MAG: PDZ domain-containing protein [Candidatus Nealsonbacteria bacterium]|nr:PDZ domain-containing protein [Candidatus Nealsonbacteria bacterium]